MRQVQGIYKAQSTSDGAGVKLYRSLGTQSVSLLDPFLLLDEFYSDDPRDYLAGFPDHPHRGFETVTYMLHGRMEHRDSVGNQGLLESGGLQWMTAGSGIIHSEMPRQEDGLLWGFQLWVNLPAAHKWNRPRYQDIAPSSVPEVVLPKNGRVKVLAGEFAGQQGPVDGITTRPLFLDLKLEPGGQLDLDLPAGHQAFAYVYRGSPALGTPPKTVMARHLVDLGQAGEHLTVQAEEAASLILVAGQPLNEPVARGGPFVMNTRAELLQAFDDYQSGQLVKP